jgi:hypothetical protein
MYVRCVSDLGHSNSHIRLFPGMRHRHAGGYGLVPLTKTR